MVDVSVVMSVYNAEPYLEDAIKSILGQTYQDFEFIIIDDGSTDQSAEIIKSFHDERIIFLQQTNKGLAYSLNRGIRESHGKYVARMDADDESLPTRLALQKSFLDEHADYVVVGSGAIVMDKDGCELYVVKMPMDDGEIRDRLPYKPIFYHSSTMYVKSTFFACGGYNEKIHHFFEDLILWNQMSKNGKLHNFHEPLIKYRLTPTSITYNKPRDRELTKRIIFKINSGENLSTNDVNYIESLKRGRSIQQKKSDYYYSLGNIHHNLLGEQAKAKNYYISALKQNPFNIKALIKLIQSLISKTTGSPEHKLKPWITMK